MQAQILPYFRNVLLYLFFACFNIGAYAQIKQAKTNISTDVKEPGFEVISNKQCTLQITGFSGNTLSLAYQTLPANQAGLNSNSLWLWRASEVPWNYAPEKMQLLPVGSTQSGYYMLDGISIASGADYIACYSLDSTVREICACAVLGEKIDSTKNTAVTMQLLQAQGNSLSLSYNTLSGYLPQTYGNWFGVWKGSASPYNAPKPMATGKPMDDSNSGTATLNGLLLESGQTYTLMYFLGKQMTHAAVLLTFKMQ